MKKGDMAFFYHSVVRPPAIMGVVKIVKEAYPDPYALNKKSKYYYPKSSKENPIWFGVEIKAVQTFKEPLTLDELKTMPQLKKMKLLKKGSRLSVQPVTPSEWKAIMRRGT